MSVFYAGRCLRLDWELYWNLLGCLSRVSGIAFARLCVYYMNCSKHIE
jgi:hypothetical protein